VLRTGWYALAVVGALAAVFYVGARLAMPAVAEKKGELEALISRESGYRVGIEQLEGYWDGLHPGLRLRGVDIAAPDDSYPAVRLDELRISLQIFPLLAGRLDIHAAVLVRPRLTLERLTDGRFRISGFAPIGPDDPARTETFMAWFFRQGRLAVEDGDLLWIDRRDETETLRLTKVNLQLRNRGEHHRLGVSAEFPNDMCASCSFAADVDGNPLLGQSFEGDIYVRARSLNVERLPRIVREQLPPALRGVFSVETWSEWEESMPVALEGELSVADLRLPLAGLNAPLSVKQASTRVRWSGGRGGFNTELRGLTLALHGKPWTAGRLRFARQQRETRLQVERIELGDVTAFIDGLRMDDHLDGAEDTELLARETAARWRELKPGGTISDLTVQLTGALGAPEDYTLAAEVSNLSVRPYRGWPGVRGVSGTLRATPERGTLTLGVQTGALALPRIFRAPLPITRADAELRWQRADGQWQIAADNILLRNEDINASGRMRLRLPDDPEQSPHLALKMEFRDGNGANAARYYPVHQLSPATLAWMEYSFAGGQVTRGKLEYDGHTRDFPFHEGNGKFEIEAGVRNGVYRYLRGWEPVTAVVANVAVKADRFTVTGHGRIGTLQASDIVVGTGDPGTVRVRANVAGPVAESLRVLRGVDAAPGEDRWKQWLLPGLNATGEGVLSLDLSVPIDPGPTRVSGEYRFLNGTLGLGDSSALASKVVGSLRFNEDGVREGKVSARLYGEELALAIDSPGADDTMAVLRGRATQAALTSLFGPALAPRIGGAVPWEARLRLANGRTELSGDADLSALRVSLPAPFNKPNGFGAESLRVRTEATTRDDLTLGVSLGTLVRARLRLERRGGWQFAGGRLVVSDPPTRLPESITTPAERGLNVVLRLDELDLDRWSAALGRDAGGERSEWIARIGAHVGHLSYLERDLGAMAVSLVRDQKGWTGGISGPAAEGRVRIETASATRVALDLAHLHVPAARTESSAAETDPRKLPFLTLKARSFRRNQLDLGELDFAASPNPQGWRVERLVLVRPESRFEANGSWRVEQGKPQCSFTARLSTQDAGATLAALGLPEQIEGSEVELTAALAWAGTPANLEYESMSGNLELHARKGRFLQIEQGAARLFGILDISAIARYLTLDFSPVFGKGFAFDNIDGKVAIERGDANTSDLTINGPTARLNFSGRVGLANEDFNLVLDVYPSLADSLTIGSLVAGGPQVALWTFLVQKLFKKQIEEGTRVSYVVRGPWRKPEISRKLGEVSPVESPPQTN
jgi:uncharacterized protein (TIGR02099 family)